MTIIRWIVAFVAAVAVTTVLGVVASSAAVVQGLEASGAAVSAADFARLAQGDLVGLGPLYGALAAGVLLVGFIAAGLLSLAAPAIRGVLFAALGAVAMTGLMVGLEQVFGQQPIAGAREPLGLAAQGLAGLIGGTAFALLRPKKR